MAVVGDHEGDGGRRALDAHVDFVAGRMTSHVGEGLPGDPVQGGAGRTVDGDGLGRDVRRNRQARPPILVHQRHEIGGSRKGAIHTPLVGAQRRDRGTDLVEAGPPDRLGVEQGSFGLVEVAPQARDGRR